MSYGVLDKKGTFESNFLGQSIYNYLDRTFDIPESFSFSIIRVTSDYIARPDLISLQVYGDDKYTDILCKLNGISNPFELNEDEIIVCPDMGSLNYFYIIPNPENSESNSSDSTPKAKVKTQKRKPNEAIIGDTRYTIDSKNRIIIY